MPTIDVDVIDGSRLVETIAGAEKVRIYRVFGFDSETPADEKEVEALDHVPAMGTAYAPSPNLRVEQREVVGIGHDHVEVRVTYRTPSGLRMEVGDAPQIEIVGTLETAVTDQDNLGNLVTVDYSGDSDNPEIPPYVKEVRYQRPTFVYRHTRREATTDEAVSTLARTYVGHVNDATFMGQPPRTWLVLPLIGRSDDGGETFVIRRELAFNPETWDAVVKAVNPETGQIPGGVSEGDGIEVYEVLPEADLSGFGL